MLAIVSSTFPIVESPLTFESTCKSTLMTTIPQCFGLSLRFCKRKAGSVSFTTSKTQIRSSSSCSWICERFAICDSRADVRSRSIRQLPVMIQSGNTVADLIDHIVKSVDFRSHLDSTDEGYDHARSENVYELRYYRSLIDNRVNSPDLVLERSRTRLLKKPKPSSLSSIRSAISSSQSEPVAQT